jgi:predicted dehydrogenase
MERIRVGIVGGGEVTQIIHLPSLYQLSEQFEVTALCDVSQKVLDCVGEQWRIDRRFQDYRDLVEDAEIDAVLVTNPHVFHAEVVLAALAAGKHVLVEKPMCISLEEADQIISAQEQSGTVVQVGYMRRYAPAFAEACQQVQAMERIGMARVHDVIGANALIIRQIANVIRGDDLSAAMKAAARTLQNNAVESALGGPIPPGIRRAYLLMLGLSSHDLSAMRELLGRPQRVLYAAWRETGDLNAESDAVFGRYLSAAFDYGSYICHFETGIDKLPRFDAHIQVFGTDRVLRIQYNTPYVRHLPTHLYATEAYGETGLSEQRILPNWEDPFVAEWKAFYNNVIHGQRSKTNPADFREDLELFVEMVRCLSAGSQAVRQ